MNDNQEIISKTEREIPWKNNGIIRSASAWLGNNGILTDFHKNTLIMGVMLESKSIKNVEFFVMSYDNTDNGKFGLIVIIAFVSRWFMWFRNKNKLISSIQSKASEFLPSYDITVNLKVFHG